MKTRFIFLFGLSLLITRCSSETHMNKISQLAEQYVKFALSAGKLDGDFVDAYYGPTDWKTSAQDISIDSLTSIAMSMVQELNAIILDHPKTSELVRATWLKKQIIASAMRLRVVAGEKVSFDEESQALFDGVAPTFPQTFFDSLLTELEKKVPGTGSVSERVNTFRNEFIIPKEKLDTVFKTAIAEGKKRTALFIQLPPTENFELEFVTDKSWSGYNWYAGNYQSKIQINTDLPIFIDRAIDLASHEGYPGHHVYNVLFEENLYRKKGWVEISLYPLFSPQSLIAEGSANYGIDVAFPGNERIEYEEKVLLPLAGLSGKNLTLYYDLLKLTSKLSYAGNVAAKGLLDGKFTEDQAKYWLVHYALFSPERAEQRLKFIKKYRSYVINYNYGKDLVQDYIERHGGTSDRPDKRWKLFTDLLSRPMTASDLLK